MKDIKAHVSRVEMAVQHFLIRGSLCLSFGRGAERQFDPKGCFLLCGPDGTGLGGGMCERGWGEVVLWGPGGQRQ